MNGYGTEFIAALKQPVIALSLAITIFNFVMLWQDGKEKAPADLVALQGKLDTLSTQSTNLAQQVDQLSADSKKLAGQIADVPAVLINSFEFVVQASTLGEPRKEATVGCGNEGVLAGGSCIGFTTDTQVAIGPVFYNPLQAADGKPISTIRCQPYTSEAGMRVRAFAVCMRQKR